MTRYRRHRRIPLAVTAAAALSVAALVTAGVGSAAGEAAPVNTSPPTLSGEAMLGKTLTASSGSWSGTTPMTFSYQWRRCVAAGSPCASIAAATAQTFTLTPADVGNTVRVQVTATNSDGSAQAESAPTVVVTGANGPTNTSAPTISGIARDRETLTANNGGWSGTQPISYAYQWLRCASNGASCGNIGGATGRTYTVQSADVGHTLRVNVTASNSAGTGQALSSPTGVVASVGTAPASSGAPALSGNAVVNQTLTLSNGSWTGTAPISFRYGWQRCDANGNACVAISGPNGNSYKLVVADSGHRIRGVVTASNVAGTTTAVTAPSAVVGGTPVPTKLPTISGTAQVGVKLTANGGTWSTPTPLTAVTFQWSRCDSAGKNCVPIPNAQGPAYIPVAADVGHRLIVEAKAQNALAAGFANSPPTAVVAAAGATPAPTPSPPRTPAAGCPSGSGAIQVASLAPPARLTIDGQRATPSVVHRRSTRQLTLSYHVTACGRPVQGALVYVTATPFNQLTIPREQPTGADGWATLHFSMLRGFPVSGRQQLIAIFVRARKPGENLLGGISARRLFSVHVRA